MTLDELIAYLEKRRYGFKGNFRGDFDMAFVDVNLKTHEQELHYFEGGYETGTTVVLCCKDYT